MVVTVKCSSLLRHVEGHVKKYIIHRKTCQWAGGKIHKKEERKKNKKESKKEKM
jgi:hypothetical protein